jgi:hypothetical protein
MDIRLEALKLAVECGGPPAEILSLAKKFVVFLAPEVSAIDKAAKASIALRLTERDACAS